MLARLASTEIRIVGTSELATICDAGARYALGLLEAALPVKLDNCLSSRAKQSLRTDIRRQLIRISRATYDLESKSYDLALQALGLANRIAGSRASPRGITPARAAQRLHSMLERFPELARLWLHLISQWQQHIREVLTRFDTDRRALARAFFQGRVPARIINIRSNLSEPHQGGRTVARLVLDTGSVIYKPRNGDSEWEWNELMKWMNQQSFRPALRPVEVLRRNGYCWMEYVAPLPCRDKAAAKRFFERLGGLIAAAHVLKAVDCHRENVIACAEWPVLVDADALWHVSPLTKTQSQADVLYRTGFFPNRNRQSLQSRSSVLGPAKAGFHLAQLKGNLARPPLFAREIVKGFEAGWRALLGTAARRSSLQRRLRRIRSRPRRWIYRATATYGAIRRASLQPAALRSAEERAAVIRQLCRKRAPDPAVLAAEVRSLLDLDIPYFIRRTNEWLPPDRVTPPSEVIEAIIQALRW